MSDRTEFVEVECRGCGKRFNKTVHRYKEAQKMGWEPFCSRKCQGFFRKRSIELECSECGKDIIIAKHDYDSSLNKRFFCSRRCSAIFNNKIGGHRSEEEKASIREGLKRYYDAKGRKPLKHKPVTKRIPKEKLCLTCGGSFRPKSDRHICCSTNCYCLYQFGTLPCTKDEVTNIIVNIAKDTSLTPQQRDCDRRLVHAAVKFFGTWNKAMLSCGLKPNHSKYRKTRLKCLDGHMADSLSEKIIDDWLFQNNIRHERGKRYPNSRMDCDFYLLDHDMWVEYFGLSGGDFKEYEETMNTKREMVRNGDLNFIEMVPADLYNDKKKTYADKLNKIFGKYIKLKTDTQLV